MKFIIGAVIVIGLAVGGWNFYHYYQKFEDKTDSQPAVAAPPSGDSLPGMPQTLEPTLEAARQRGAKGLHDFLTVYGRNISDPRLASIELDYVLLVAQSDPAEARKVFARVKKRTTSDSPVYPRVQQLEKTYD
jgi:hypothetical protein